MSTIPTSAFCERASSDGMTEAKFDAVKDLETRLRAEFELSREKNRAENRVEFEKSRASNRARISELEKSRAGNKERLAALEKSRAGNKERLAALEKSRAENRKRIAAMEKASKKNRRTINGFIYLTRLRENVRMVEKFFNELYKKWVAASGAFGGKNLKYAAKWKHDTQLRLDYDRYPNAGAQFSSRAARLGAPGVSDAGRYEAEYRRKRAKAFLSETWVKFGGDKSITIAEWLRLVRFVEQTNAACHASPSFGGASRAANVVAAQRLVRPDVRVDSVEQLMTDILFMIDTLGRNSWTSDSAWNFAMENRGLFPNWPAA
jgi:hypothetical protein